MELCSLPEFGLRPDYGRGSGGNGGLLQKDLCQHVMVPRAVVVIALDPAAGHCQPTPLLETPGHSQACLAQSLVGSFLLSPGSWYAQTFVVPSKSLFTWGFSVLWPGPQAEKPVVGPRTFATVQELLWYNCSPFCGENPSIYLEYLLSLPYARHSFKHYTELLIHITTVGP